MEWLKVAGLILGIIFTLEKIILTALQIRKELTSDGKDKK